MSIDQLNIDFNDSLQTYYPAMGFFRRFCNRTLGRIASSLLRLRRDLFSGRVIANERIVEYSVALRWLPESGRILDVGSASSRLPLQLASLGYDVWAIDVRTYPLQHQRLHFVQDDLFEWETNERFNVITAISTIEHFGIGLWGDRRQPGADRQLLERLSKLALPNGVLIASMPFGRSGVTPLHRVYDVDSLDALFKGFPIRRKVFFRREDLGWVPSSEKEAAEQPYDELPVRAVVILEVLIG